VVSINELSELVDFPNETLDVEYKSSLILSDSNDKANLARHIAAISNYGGGKIVFGFNDDMTVADSIPTHIEINRDTVSSVVKKYLEPTIACDVHAVRSNLGTLHQIIVVPGHGSSPICAKASGPDKNGKPAGICQGIYYIRKPGPSSEPIIAASEWQPVIRRCAMHDKAGLLAAISGALSQPETDSASVVNVDRWHNAARIAFNSRLVNKRISTDIARNNVQFSYLIESDGESLKTNQLERTLSEVNSEVKDLVSTGWSMMYIFGKQDIGPYWESDETSGYNDDFLECSQVDKELIGESADFWRVSPDGRVTLIRDLWEDTLNTQARVQPYTIIDPDLMIRSLAEIVRHARALSARFSSAARIHFICEWRGIKGRASQRIGGYSFRAGKVAGADLRISKGSWPVAELTQHWDAVVAHLAIPMARSLGIEDMVEAPRISELSTRWDRIG